MAINVIQRRAIWEARGKRCAYCTEPVLFQELEIDHIVPRNCFEDPEQWKGVKETQGLSDQFDPEGIENLSPACRACNGKKRAQMLAPGRLGIELATASKYAVQIRDAVQSLAEANQRDLVRLAIATAVASGQVSPSEIDQLAVKMNNDAGIFRLSPGAWIFEDQLLGDLSAEDYERYLDKPVVLGQGEIGLQLACANGAVTHVATLREFDAATSDGCYPVSSWARSMAYQHFSRPLALLRILKAAHYAEKSFIRSPYIGLSDVELLPATLLWVTEEMTSDAAFAEQIDQLRGLTIHDMVKRGARIDDVGSRMLAVHFNGGRTYLLEMLRADIDSDGVEEIILHRGGGPLDGTYRAASLVGLARRSDSSTFEEVELPVGP